MLPAAPLRRTFTSPSVGGQVLAELGEERLVEPEGDLDLGDDPLLVLRRQAERVEAGAVGVLVGLGLRDLRERVEGDAPAVELEGPVEDPADGLAAGEVTEVARV